ncbi:MAG: protein-disulfide reductase DsbD [Gammaproteobacteria bacterium]|nr:protein-disulfide reductase DsbD [Gammaproteobacteria bacterium]|tara:strand:+ start:1074 stop:2825 length:1752 start_codon:yes stop_codon:yes gene_type:complete
MKIFNIKNLFVTMLFLFVSSFSTADIIKNQVEFLSPEEAFQPSIRIITNNHLEVTWDIKQGYYLYLGMFEFSVDNSDMRIIKVNMPEGKKKKDEFFGDVDVYYNSAKANIYFDKITSKTNLILKYQGCADAGLCYPPITKKFSLEQYAENSSYLLKTSSADNQYSFSERLSQQSVFLNISLFFLAGLLLAFTPCVFPMIPILTGLIVGQGENISTKKSFLLSLTYVLSMSLTYAGAGVLIALSGTNIQADLQNPYVISSFALLFIILALSMFNVIKLQMPTYIQSLLISKSNASSSGTYIGVGIMGSLSALIVGPCVTAPLIGALIYISLTNDFIIGGAALFSLGMGMGAPLLILGTSASELTKKIGPYLDITNKIFGILFLIVSVWLIERIVSVEVAAYLWAILSIITAVGLLKIIVLKTFTKFIVNVLSGLLFLYSGLQIYGVNINKNFNPTFSFIEQSQSVQFTKIFTTEKLFKQIKDSKKITLVDLYADWCVACKELDKYTFSEKKVSSLLENLNLIKFDITKTSEDNSKFLKDYKLYGPPAMLFFNSDGEEIRQARVVGFIDADNFIEIYKSLNISLK